MYNCLILDTILSQQRLFTEIFIIVIVCKYKLFLLSKYTFENKNIALEVMKTLILWFRNI